MIFLRTKRAFEVKWKAFFLVWQVLSFILKKQTSQNVADVTFKINRDNNKFMTSVCRKPAFSGVFTNFRSFILKSYKYSLLFTLLHREFKPCSNFDLFHQEIDKLNIIFENYPKSFVDFCIKKYLYKVFIKKELLLKASKKELICILPFIGKKSLQLRTCLVNSKESNF